MYEFIRMSKLLQNDYDFQMNADGKLKNEFDQIGI